MYTFTYDDGDKSAAGSLEHTHAGVSGAESGGGITPLLPVSRSTSLGYDTGTTVRPVDLRHSPTATTMIYDRSIGIVQPTGGPTATISTAPGSRLRSLVAVQAGASGVEIPRPLIDAILLDSELISKLERASKRASPSASNPVPREDVSQETILRLLERISNRPLSYHDQGESKFGGWIRTVVNRTAQKARDAQAPNVAQVLVEDMSQFPAPVADAERAELIEDIRAAVPKIPKADVRHAIEDFLCGLTLGESAESRGCSDSHTCDLLREGKDWLRRYLYGE